MNVMSRPASIRCSEIITDIARVGDSNDNMAEYQIKYDFMYGS